MRKDQELRNNAALWIQARWRAHRGQLSSHILKVARQARREYNAAALVQAHWRGKMGRITLARLKKERTALEKSQLQAATLMQGLYRGFRDRKNVKTIKLQFSLEKLKLHDLFAWGATMVQKNFRAYVRCCLCVCPSVCACLLVFVVPLVSVACAV